MLMSIYNEFNKTERYLFDICIIANYSFELLSEFKKLKYIRVFLGYYYCETKKKDMLGFHVVIDTSMNNNIKDALKVIFKRLELRNSLFIANIVNPTSVTLVLKTGLSERSINYFLDSQYSKIFKVGSTYPILNTNIIKKYYRSQTSSKLPYNNTYLILTKSDLYFEKFIKPHFKNADEVQLNKLKSKEYDAPIILEDEMYNHELIINN